MPRKRSLIPATPMAEILKAAGAERVSESGAKALAEVLMEIANNIAKDAIKYAQHAGRKTIKKEDIDLARKSA